MKENIEVVIANNIRAERNRAHLSQEETAMKLGITNRTYLTYEANARNVSASIIYQLANIFGCNISDFYLNCNFTKCERLEQE